MNKIIVSKNGIISDYNNVIVKDNEIRFDNDGEYLLEYIDSGKYNINFVVNASVKLYETSFRNQINVNNRYILDGGYLDVIKFYDNDSVNEIIDINLLNDGDKINYSFVDICRNKGVYTVNINHKCKNTISNINNKSIALKDSINHFVINSNVCMDSYGCILNQNTRIVTMGECDTKICPNMFIDLDDVEAKHGSIIGSFKNETIFYLMSKGINYNDSIKLLLSGYILSGIGKNHYLRKEIIDTIDSYWR